MEMYNKRIFTLILLSVTFGYITAEATAARWWGTAGASAVLTVIHLMGTWANLVYEDEEG